MGVQQLGQLAGRLEAPGSMPNSTMDRLECAVAGQLQCLARWQARLVSVPGKRITGAIEFNGGITAGEK